MLASLATQVPTFGSLLGLGGIFFVAIYLYAVSDAAENVTLKYDPQLRDRMDRLSISSWKDLRQKSGLSRLLLRKVRQGEIAELKQYQLTNLAAALNWKTEELLKLFGIASRESEIEELRREALRLREELQQQRIAIDLDLRDSIFQQLQTLLTNYPSVRQMVKAKPDLPARNVISLFAPLDNLVASWSYETIGSPWQQVPYDPQLHQPDAGDIMEGELVYVRFVGYQDGDRILCPAKVSRTLPPGIKN